MIPRMIFLPSLVLVATVVLIEMCSRLSSLGSGIVMVELIESHLVDKDGENGSLLQVAERMSCSKTVVFK